MTTGEIIQPRAAETPRACSECQVEIPEGAGRLLGEHLLCDECFAKFHEQMRAESRERNRFRFREAKARKLLRDDFLRAGFERSLPEVEALNLDAFRQGRDWKNDRNIFITGPVGSGKSFLALSLLRRIFARGYSVGHVSGRRLTKTAARFDEGRGALEDWKGVHTLLLDDLDKGEWDKGNLGALWDLLDERTAGGRWTLVTSNLDKVKLRDYLREQAGMNQSTADAALDRLKPCLTLTLLGESLRRVG